MYFWKVKYEKLLEQFNDLQVAYDANCDKLKMLEAAAGNTVHLFSDCFFLVVLRLCLL